MWEVNLDRFSRKGPNEYGEVFHSKEEDVQEVMICQGCKEEIIDGDDFVESEIWEDDFIHNYGTCIASYYRKEKTLLLVAKESE